MRHVAIIIIFIIDIHLLVSTSLAADPPMVAVPPTKASPAADLSEKLDLFIATLRKVESKTVVQEEAERFSWWKHK